MSWIKNVCTHYLSYKNTNIIYTFHKNKELNILERNVQAIK